MFCVDSIENNIDNKTHIVFNATQQKQIKMYLFQFIAFKPVFTLFCNSVINILRSWRAPLSGSVVSLHQLNAMLKWLLIEETPGCVSCGLFLLMD